jgi:hypothetical protein
MGYKIIFSLIFLCLPLVSFWDYDKYIDYNMVDSIMVTLPSGSGSEDILENKAWYYIVIDSITVSNNCDNIWCTNNTQLWGIYNGTWQIAIYNYLWADSSYTIQDNTIIKNNLYIGNASDEVTLFLNINYHYVRYNESILANIEYYVKDNREILDNVISYILIYVIYLFLFYFFAKKWYKIGADYFIKKRND